MSTFILHIDNQYKEAIKEIQQILNKVKGEINPVNRFSLEDEYLHKQMIASKKTPDVSFEEGIAFMKKSIKKHGSKI